MSALRNAESFLALGGKRHIQMKQTFAGSGQNTTSSVLSYLAGTTQPLIKNLYIIGPPDNPYSLFMTDYETPLSYQLYPQKNFSPAVVTRGNIKCKIGLDSDSVDLTWSPGPNTYSNTVASANPRTLAMQGYYDNWPVLMLAAFMPTPGDVNTLGCAITFAGMIASTNVDREKIYWTVNSNMVLLDQQVPTNVIEATNSLANYGAATPPTGFTTIPQFTTFTGSTDTIIYGDVLPPYGTAHIFTTNVFQGGYLIFIPGTGSTLSAFWGSIAGNQLFMDGHGNNHNQFEIYQPLPWPPTPFAAGSGDQFIVSAPVPTTGGFGFQYVPAPESAF